MQPQQPTTVQRPPWRQPHALTQHVPPAPPPQPPVIPKPSPNILHEEDGNSAKEVSATVVPNVVATADAAEDIRQPAASVLDDMQLKLVIAQMASRVFAAMGPGFREQAYQKAMEVELAEEGLEFLSQGPVPIYYRGYVIAWGVADIIVDKRIVVELKAVSHNINATEINQCRAYLRAAHLDNGIVINFPQHRVSLNDVEVFDCFLDRSLGYRRVPREQRTPPDVVLKRSGDFRHSRPYNEDGDRVQEHLIYWANEAPSDLKHSGSRDDEDDEEDAQDEELPMPVKKRRIVNQQTNTPVESFPPQQQPHTLIHAPVPHYNGQLQTGAPVASYHGHAQQQPVFAVNFNTRPAPVLLSPQHTQAQPQPLRQRPMLYAPTQHQPNFLVGAPQYQPTSEPYGYVMPYGNQSQTQ